MLELNESVLPDHLVIKGHLVFIVLLYMQRFYQMTTFIYMSLIIIERYCIVRTLKKTSEIVSHVYV